MVLSNSTDICRKRVGAERVQFLPNSHNLGDTQRLEGTGPKLDSGSLVSNRKELGNDAILLVLKQFWWSNLLNRLARFCVLYHGFRGRSALSGPKMDPNSPSRPK